MLVNTSHSHISFHHKNWTHAIGHSGYQEFIVLPQLIHFAMSDFNCHHLYDLDITWPKLEQLIIMQKSRERQKQTVASWIFNNGGFGSAFLTISDRMSNNMGVFFWIGLTSNLLRPSAIVCTKGECELDGDCTLARLCTQFSALTTPSTADLDSSFSSRCWGIGLHNVHLQEALYMSACALLPRLFSA